MKAQYTLYAYVPGFGRKRISLAKKNVKPPEGATTFYLRYRDETGERHNDSLGTDFRVAVEEVLTRQAARDFEEKTGRPLPVEKKTAKTERAALSGVMKDWLEQKRIAPGIASSTIPTYTYALKKFEEFANGKILNVQDIKREDLFRFSLHLLEEQKLSRRTASHYFACMIIFLKGVGINLHIPVKQWGVPPKRKPQAYTQEQLDSLFLVATAEESLLFKSYLFSGMRNKELAHLTYGDIDFKHSIWN